MARSRDQGRFDDQRQKILTAAAGVFSDKGFHGATMEDIADQLGTTKASIYYYYKSKDIVLYEICRATVDAAVEYLDEILSDESLSESDRLRVLISRHLQFMEDNVDAWTVFFHELGGRDDPEARAIRKKQREFADGIEHMITQAMNSGHFRSVLPTRIVVLGILGMSNWSHRWIKGEKYSAQDIADVFSDLLFRGLDPAHP